MNYLDPQRGFISVPNRNSPLLGFVISRNICNFELKFRDRTSRKVVKSHILNSTPLFSKYSETWLHNCSKVKNLNKELFTYMSYLAQLCLLVSKLDLFVLYGIGKDNDWNDFFLFAKLDQKNFATFIETNSEWTRVED